MKRHMWHLCGKPSIYTWRNKLVPLEVWLGKEGRREEAGWGPWTSERRWSRAEEDTRKGQKDVCPGPGHHLQCKYISGGKTPSPRVRNCSITKPANWASHLTFLSLSFPTCPLGRVIISPPQATVRIKWPGLRKILPGQQHTVGAQMDVSSPSLPHMGPSSRNPDTRPLTFEL